MKEQFFQLARKVAQKSPSRFKIGAVITSKKGKVLSIGWNNMRKTHPKCFTYGNFLHAEIDALLGLDYKETKKGIVYIFRETAHGELANSRPCETCYEAIRQSGIKKMYYTDSQGYKEEEIG